MRSARQTDKHTETDRQRYIQKEKYRKKERKKTLMEKTFNTQRRNIAVKTPNRQTDK